MILCELSFMLSVYLPYANKFGFGCQVCAQISHIWMVGLTINSARGTQENVVFSDSLKWLCANFNVIFQDLDKLAIRSSTYYNLFRSVQLMASVMRVFFVRVIMK